LPLLDSSNILLPPDTYKNVSGKILAGQETKKLTSKCGNKKVVGNLCKPQNSHTNSTTGTLCTDSSASAVGVFFYLYSEQLLIPLFITNSPNVSTLYLCSRSHYLAVTKYFIYCSAEK